MPQPQVDRPSTATLLGTVAVVLLAVAVTALALAPSLQPAGPTSGEGSIDELSAAAGNATDANETAAGDQSDRPLERVDTTGEGDEPGMADRDRAAEGDPEAPTDDDRGPPEDDRGPPAGDGRGPSDGTERGPPDGSGPPGGDRGPPDGAGPPGR
ncbi:hypothetical protein [Natrinema thermotolerans]